MQVTKNYGLIKQELTDAADITQISQNWDKIDTELKKLDDEKFDKAGGTITGATTVNGKIIAKAGESIAGGLTVTGGTTTDTLKATGAITVGSVTTTGGVSAGSMTVTGDATVNGKILVDNIRAKGGSNALQVGVNNPNSTEELLGIIAQWVNGTTPRVSVTHHPDKASNDKSVATTYWIKQLIATQSEYGLVKLASEEDLLNEAPQNAICTELIYDINEFRRKSKAYKVGEKVDCAFQYERFLECTKAGTTSANLLDTRNVTHGQKIVDGTVEWTVRTHARSVNNAVADANGNVSIQSYSHPNSGVQAGSYNTVQVDAQGHVTGGANVDYAKSVNGVLSKNGAVTIDVGVKSVNGSTPDSNGNVVISDGLKDVLTAANMAISKNLVNTGQVDLATVLNTVNALNAEYQRLKETLNGAKFIIETGNNKNGWYRKWSDGWIEQGNLYIRAGNSEIWKTHNFPISFTTLNFSFVTNPIHNNSTQWCVEKGNSDGHPERTLQSVTVYGDISFSWYACGY